MPAALEVGEVDGELDPELALLLPDDDVEPDEPLEDVCELVGEEPGAVEVVLDAAEVEAREADVVELEVEPLAEDAPAARKVSRHQARKRKETGKTHQSTRTPGARWRRRAGRGTRPRCSPRRPSGTRCSCTCK